MVIANDEQMSNTPWTYLDWVFQEPIQETMTNGNYGRYENQEAFDLVVQLDQTPIDDRAGMQEIISQIQQIQLQELPVIPLWYNGLWSQYSESTWTNWPSAEEGNQFLPTTWRGYLQMSGIQTLAALEPAPPAEEPQG
jgi:peptide/nickel transport system substrate-binding protein